MSEQARAFKTEQDVKDWYARQEWMFRRGLPPTTKEEDQELRRTLGEAAKDRPSDE